MASEAEQLQQRLEQAELLAAAHSSKQQQRQPAAAAAGGAAEDGDVMEVDAEQLASGFRGFMQHLAGVEGAEVPTTTPAAVAAAAASGSHSQGSKRHSSNAGSSGVRQPEQKQPGKQQRSRGAPAAAAGGDATGLDFNPDAFLSELMGVLGAIGDPLQQQQQQQSPAQAEALLRQAQMLQQALEQKLAVFPGDQAAFTAAASSWGGGDGVDSDDYGGSGSSSSDEGSSFYGSDSEGEVEGEDGPEVGGGEVLGVGATAAAAELGTEFLEVPPPCSGRPSANGVTEQQQQQRQYRTRQDPQQQQQQQQQWAQDSEVVTETDSDDDEDALSLGGSSDGSSGSDDGSSGGGTPGEGGAGSGGFYDSYSAALEAELAATTMAQTFEKVQVTPPGAAVAGTLAASITPAAADGIDAGLTPLDVDFNLIQSLVASYTAQGGLPGPASNLAGLLGVQLPTELDTQQQYQQQQQQ
jgi:hypothetical protein